MLNILKRSPNGHRIKLTASVQQIPSHSGPCFLSSLTFLPLLLSLMRPLHSGHNRLFIPWLMLFLCSHWLLQCHLVKSNSNPPFPLISLCLALTESNSPSLSFLNKNVHGDGEGCYSTIHSSGSSPFCSHDRIARFGPFGGPM